jgi:predicted ferric reductase
VLVLAFAGFHAVALLVDRFVGFTPLEVLVPFVSDFRPLGVGLGILTLYLFLVIYLSFSVRRQIGFRIWRSLHYGGFVTFTLATYHSILAGTDSNSIWLLGVYGACGALVLALAVYRFIAGEGIDERQLRALETQERSTPPSEAPAP